MSVSFGVRDQFFSCSKPFYGLLSWQEQEQGQEQEQEQVGEAPSCPRLSVTEPAGYSLLTGGVY